MGYFVMLSSLHQAKPMVLLIPGRVNCLHDMHTRDIHGTFRWYDQVVTVTSFSAGSNFVYVLKADVTDFSIHV
jgi:hypothetical protein